MKWDSPSLSFLTLLSQGSPLATAFSKLRSLSWVNCMPQRRIGVRARAALSHRNENRRRCPGVVGSRDDGRKSRSSARYATSRRVEHDESAIARLTERPVGRAVRLMPALAPALAAVRCEGLTDGHDDDARRDDDRRTAPTARRVADDDTTSGAQQQQRCGKNALHGGLRIEFVDRAQCETDAARSRRGSITQLRASPWLRISSASRQASGCVISRVATRVALQQPSLPAARQLLSVA